MKLASANIWLRGWYPKQLALALATEQNNSPVGLKSRSLTTPELPGEPPADTAPSLPEILGAEVHPAGSPVFQTTTGPEANAPPGAILFLSDPERA